MRPSVAAVAQLVNGIVPGEQEEADEVRTTLRWLNETDDVFRRVKPAVPDPHLVSYVIPVDPDSSRMLLGEHLNAGLWLPPGGHVEVDEHPAVTAGREAVEELGVDPRRRLIREPLFLSATVTVGVDSGHTDVSLWFVLRFRRDEHVRVDCAEFKSMRWWSVDEICAAAPAQFDPALGRFITKLAASGVASRQGVSRHPSPGPGSPAADHS